MCLCNHNEEFVGKHSESLKPKEIKKSSLDISQIFSKKGEFFNQKSRKILGRKINDLSSKIFYKFA
jgi:hypothetical protein